MLRKRSLAVSNEHSIDFAIRKLPSRQGSRVSVRATIHDWRFVSRSDRFDSRYRSLWKRVFLDWDSNRILLETLDSCGTSPPSFVHWLHSTRLFGYHKSKWWFCFFSFSTIAKSRIDRFGRSSLQSLFSFVSHLQDVDSYGFDSTLPGYPFISLLDESEVTSESYCNWLLRVADSLVGSGIRKAVELVRGGIAWMMDVHSLAMFSIQEISEMLLGNAPMWTNETIDSLFVFNASESALESVNWLKEIVLEMSNAQKEQFLMFVTGQRRMNADSSKLHVEFVDCDESSLPTSMTCVNLLRLPRYVGSLIALDS